MVLIKALSAVDYNSHGEQGDLYFVNMASLHIFRAIFLVLPLSCTWLHCAAVFTDIWSNSGKGGGLLAVTPMESPITGPAVVNTRLSVDYVFKNKHILVI